MDIEIQDLRLLRAIAEAGTLAGAARALGMHQGNVSRQLQRVERITGLTLFRRHPRGVVPTMSGRLLMNAADTVLPLVDELLAETARHTAPPIDGGPARLGSVPTHIRGVLLDALTSVCPQAPIELRVEDASAQFVGMVRAASMDLAVIRHWPVSDAALPDGVHTAVVARERLHVGLAVDHPLAGRGTVRLSDLEGCGTRLLADGGHGALRRHVTAAAQRAGLRLPITSVPEWQEAVERAHTSDMAVLSYAVPRPTPGLIHLPLADETTHCLLLLAWPGGGRLAPYAANLVSLLRGAYAGTSGA